MSRQFIGEKFFTAVFVTVLFAAASCNNAQEKKQREDGTSKQPMQLSVSTVAKDTTRKPVCCRGIPSRQKFYAKK